MDFTEKIRTRAVQRLKESPHIYGARSSNGSCATEIAADSDSVSASKDRTQKCISRLAMLASEINHWEDDLHTCLKTTDEATNRNEYKPREERGLCDGKSANKGGSSGKKIRGKNEAVQNLNSPLSKTCSVPLDSSVLKALEAQGFSRSESGGRLLYSYNKQNRSHDNSVPDEKAAVPSVKPLLTGSNLSKVSELGPRPIVIPSRRFQQSKDQICRESISEEPAVLSVAEKRKLFENKLNKNSQNHSVKPIIPAVSVNGQYEKDAASRMPNNASFVTDERLVMTMAVISQNKEQSAEKKSRWQPAEQRTGLTRIAVNAQNSAAVTSRAKEERDNEQSGSLIPSLLQQCTPVAIENENKQPSFLNTTPLSEDDAAAVTPDASKGTADFQQSPHTYTILKSVTPVKFSTPKPGHLYPSIQSNEQEEKCGFDYSDDDEPFSDSIKEATNLDVVKDGDGSDDSAAHFFANADKSSFTTEVFQATNDILLSYKEEDATKNTGDLVPPQSVNSVCKLSRFLSDLDRKYRPSFSPTPAKRSRDGSFLSGEDISDMSASFTYMDNSAEEESFSLSDVDADEDRRVACADEEEEVKVNRKIAHLDSLIHKEKSVTLQAVRALNLCLTNPRYANSDAYLEAEKLLLLSSRRSAAAQVEIDRLKVEKKIHGTHDKDGNPVTKGRLLISDIKVPVKQNVIQEDTKESMRNYMVCLIKCEEAVYGTAVIAATNENIVQSSNTDMPCIHFPNKFVFNEVYSDFKVTVEVYNLYIETKITCINQSSYSSHKKGHRFRFPAKKKEPSQMSQCIVSDRIKDGRWTTSSFFNVGGIIFSINEIQRNQFSLTQKTVYHSPLVGVIHMKILGNPLINTEYRGFLTMYQVISGFGAWSRYWFRHYGDQLSYWKYPDHENTQKPLCTLDLKKCVTTKVEEVEYEICARPHTFSVTFLLSSGTGPLQEEQQRYLLSADNFDEMAQWCQCLNAALRALRIWLHILLPKKNYKSAEEEQKHEQDQKENKNRRAVE